MGRMFAKLLLPILLMPAMSHAANWERIAQGGNTTVNVDIESIVKLKNGMRKVWVEYILTEPEKSIEGKPYMRIVNLYSVNCEEKTSAAERELLYDAVLQGKVVQDIKIPRARLQFEESVPESFAEIMVGFVCKAKLKK